MFEPALERTIDQRYGAGLAKVESTLNRSSIKVLSWNIARSNHSKSWVCDFKHIIKTHQPTLICLQEVQLTQKEVEHTKQALSELGDMDWSFAPNFINRLDRRYSGILVAANAQQLQSQSVLSAHCEPIANTPKVSLFVEYLLSGNNSAEERLLTVNIHAINFVGLRQFRAQLHAVESRLAEHQGSIIFAGDFNTWNQKRWQALSEMATRLGLKSVAFNQGDQGKLKRFLRSPPLDHIFYRGFSQKSHSASVIDTLPTSDHNPLLVELTGLATPPSG